MRKRQLLPRQYKKEWVCKPSSVSPVVLLRKSEAAGTTVIYLDRLLPAGSPPPFCFAKTKQRGKRPTRWMSGKAARARAGPSSLLGLAGGGVCPADTVTGIAVRSYRTISPLPPRFLAKARAGAVYFLWHFPADCSGWPLATTVALSCSDFPPPPFCFAKTKQRGRPSDPLYLIFKQAL
jgi:hypothetical protein